MSDLPKPYKDWTRIELSERNKRLLWLAVGKQRDIFERPIPAHIPGQLKLFDA